MGLFRSAAERAEIRRGEDNIFFWMVVVPMAVAVGTPYFAWQAWRDGGGTRLVATVVGALTVCLTAQTWILVSWGWAVAVQVAMSLFALYMMWHFKALAEDDEQKAENASDQVFFHEAS